MKASVKFLSVLLPVAVVTHLGTVFAAPYVLMDAAMDRISRHGKIVNQWSHPGRTSEKSRNVVRPSPDLAYSACVYDLKDGPVHVTVAAWDDYMSVSMFQHNSDNFFVINDRQAPEGVDLMLIERGAAHPAGARLVVESPSRRGIILQRRVAPTQERFDLAAAARQGDVCTTTSSKQLQ
ncbi:DUF1254 domain-containing protein [Peristeroidobacter soli]|jgi:uncharacterized membrane protein|uniref:DUF1254 domain-containing protein n=1 Tax=Peristeroidobacter soli TaxID=2497877 RepID=UPI00101D3CC8|nr:DUF1254 domain-containing protein [Peristeroidobacter soli]